MNIKHITWSAALGLVLVGCATTPPTAALVDARQEYTEANSGIAARYVPDRVYEARVALEKAEQAHERNPGSVKEAHLAYIAHRKALIAQAVAQQHMARDQLAQAKAEYEQVLVTQRDSARTRLEQQTEQLSEATDDLSQATGELESERMARMQAEREAQAALDSLKEIAKVKAEQDRTTITLSGEVLFKTNESELLPTARIRLNRVADALKDQDPGTKMTIQGHADSRGADAYNEALSQRRAESVRDYLVQQGVPSDHLDAVGRGEDEPIASNDTPEGRANNRRVEIILQKQPQGGTSPGGMPQERMPEGSSGDVQRGPTRAPMPEGSGEAEHGQHMNQR